MNTEIVEWQEGPLGANIINMNVVGEKLYAVALTDEFGYQIHLVEGFAVSTEEKAPPANIVSVFPNPTKEFLFFDKVVENLKIYDITGRLIDFKVGEVKSHNVIHLPPGEYFLNFLLEQKECTAKLIKL